VPTAFGDWREELNLGAQVVNPQQREILDKIYSQTLSRTYVNAQGYRVMLSIAYGKNQSDSLQLHKPEICYPAQGFTLLATQRGVVDLLGKPVSATRLSTSLGQRVEPITYWTVVGDHVIKGGNDKKWTELRYAMHNRIPDGMLVRVSSIDRDTAHAYALQNQFSTAMVAAIAPENRMRFAGDLTSPAAQVPPNGFTLPNKL
jgi:EpsI family protein